MQRTCTYLDGHSFVCILLNWANKELATRKNLFIIKNGKTCYCNSIDEYRVLTVIDAVVYTVVLPKKEFDVEVFVQIRLILLYNHNIN